ncbi:hypothetical protein BLOT_015162 [Blomia tropicalis]|nr:hypothetical protein BLOT_015162 [Blomia tropicalis]
MIGINNSNRYHSSGIAIDKSSQWTSTMNTVQMSVDFGFVRILDDTCPIYRVVQTMLIISGKIDPNKEMLSNINVICSRKKRYIDDM